MEEWKETKRNRKIDTGNCLWKSWTRKIKENRWSKHNENGPKIYEKYEAIFGGERYYKNIVKHKNIFILQRK